MIKNLFANIEPRTNEEAFSEILSGENVRIERIVSTGQASPVGFFFDQPWAEWVLVLSGAASLLIEGEKELRILGAGDHLLIPAHQRHRVEWTQDPTIWLAVHYRD